MLSAVYSGRPCGCTAHADKKTKDGKLDLQEFSRYYAKASCCHHLHAPSCLPDCWLKGPTARLAQTFGEGLPVALCRWWRPGCWRH